MTTNAIDPAARRLSFGKLSVQIAIWIFIVTTVLLIAFYIAYNQMPKKSPLQDWASGAMVVELILAPFGHLVGFVLGIMAIFRSGDRRGLGILGTLLNCVVVVIGVFLVYMAASGLAPR
jgi:hypothetical protein